MGEWRPISEAKKDGKRGYKKLLLWDGEGVTFGFWRHGVGWFCAESVTDYYWDNPEAMEPSPTHFMELPEPPTE